MDQPMDQDGSECTQELSEKKDYGLSLLVPLYKLMRNNCAQAMFKIVLTMFSACKFFSDNEDAPNQLNKDMFEFLKAINNKGTNKQKKKKGKPNEDKELENRSWQIFNYQDNAEILNKISVHSMLAADEEKCKLLKNLDLNFLLNIVTNAILLYPLSENALKSVIQVKDIRNELYHARYNFSRNDFDLNLKRLQNALQEIYSALGIPEDELIKQIEECKEECKKESEEPDLIFKELQKEIHEKYKPPKHYFWPTIKEASDGEDICVESLENYLRDHNSQPTLLCGRRGSGKTSTLQNEAYHLVKKINDQGDKPQFPLVILFEENPQLPLKKENFWENVINSIKNLAPKTNARYGIETLMVVLKMHIKETIFFVNWNLHDIKTQYKETSNGTWLFTYHGYPLKSADWNILIMEPLTEHQAKQLLQSLNPNPRDWEIVNRRFCACTYKNILTTPDMVKIFSEFNNDSLTGTEYELMIKYVEKKMNEGNLSNKTIEAVGRLSFYGIKKSRHQFRITEVEKEKDIGEPGQIAFFTKNRNYFELRHNTLMDFLAAIFVIENLDEACKVWLNDTVIFKRVFKFACSFWFKDIEHHWKNTIQSNGSKDDYIKKMEDYLCNFLSIKKCSTEKKKVDKSRAIPGSSTMEVDDNTLDSNTNDNMVTDAEEVEEEEILMSGNPVKNPFSKWGFLVHIDEACYEEPQILKMVANLLSKIKCWDFKCKLLDETKLRRVQKILKKVKLDPTSPVLIKIESGLNCNMLMHIWNMLKNTESLHNAVRMQISIMQEKKEGKYQTLDDRPLKDILRVIVNTHAPIYIKNLSMPLISPRISDFKFSMCGCIQKLESLEAKVYDINSLREVLVCGSLPNMKSMKIYVNLKLSEQRIDNHSEIKIPNPKNINVSLTIVYFKEIQKLLDAFTDKHLLLSLSIRGCVVDEGFKLDFSKFKNMKSLYLHCDMHFNAQLASNCALLLSVNLVLPKRLERLLLSKVPFYTDDNIHLFEKFFANYNIQRLMILDSNLSLDGARRVLNQHMFQEEETDLELEYKKMKIDMPDCPPLNEQLVLKPRLPKEGREKMKRHKPKGKEIIITSHAELKATICNSDPCQCTIKCTTNELKDLSALIKETHNHSILSFAFSNKNVIVRKDLCNELRVHCPLFEIQDEYMYQIQENEMPISSPILQLFQSLTLTQSLYIENTALTYDGVMALVNVMKNFKRKLSRDNSVEPFSLTVTSDYHPHGDDNGMNSEVLNHRIIQFLKEESCLQMLNFWCTCGCCHKLKKTHEGVIYLNDKKLKC